jgi:hypothetical protein
MSAPYGIADELCFRGSSCIDVVIISSFKAALLMLWPLLLLLLQRDANDSDKTLDAVKNFRINVADVASRPQEFCSG